MVISLGRAVVDTSIVTDVTNVVSDEALGMADARAARLTMARSVLGKATRHWEGRPRASPEYGRERVLPVPVPLRPLFPGGGLWRGGTIAVPASTSLLLALLSEASAQGSWCAVVELPELGVVAASEAGLVLSRVALVPRPEGELVAVTAALLEGLDLVALAGVARLRAGDRQRLSARARQRGAVLVAAGRWPGADLVVSCSPGRWQGLVGGGAGRLCSRRVRVRVDGRGAAHRRGYATVLLPGPSGALAGAEWSGSGSVSPLGLPAAVSAGVREAE
jgi:hypothetical protein